MGRVRRILSNPKAFSYKLIEGDGSSDNKYFAIQEDELIIAKKLDWSTPKYMIRVKTIDEGGLSFEKTIKVDVRYKNKPPY